MRRKIRRKERKKQKKILIITSLSLLLFLCVGYAAFQTNLNIKAKGNVKRKTASEQLKENVVESGDGLYKNPYEEEKYIYKGTDPNNHIIFNNEDWRIISVEADGTIKITNTNTFPDFWDRSMGYILGSYHGSNDWKRPADINTYLNGEYLNSLKVNTDKIVSHTWNVGIIEDYNNDIAEQITDEKSQHWTGKIGLITASEYLMANTNINQCNSYNLYNSNVSICNKTNWMYELVKNQYDETYGLWAITPSDTISADAGPDYTMGSVECIISVGIVPNDSGVSNWNVSPALYLSSDITLSGEGTKQDPYEITN